MNTNTIINGDALTELKKLPDECVDCIITSPPYWALRDYKVDGQIGNEKTIDEYITKLINIFNECKRILKREGTCWVVLGDSYGTSKHHGGKNISQKTANSWNIHGTVKGLEKSLCLIPERFSLKMIENKWILRNKIIWFKPNCMPSSAKDRFTVDYENIYFFTKSQRYYFNTQYEPFLSEPHIPRVKSHIPYGNGHQQQGFIRNPQKPMYSSIGGRIKRCVWKIKTKPFPQSHFAVFPEELVKQCMDAGCPSEICKKCGKSPIPVYDETRINTRVGKNVGNGKSGKDIDPNKDLHNSDLSKYRQQIIRTQNGIKKCNCNAGFEPGICLDPFMGSGTVALVALKNNRNFFGIELSKEYIEIANKRLEPYINQQKLEKFVL